MRIRSTKPEFWRSERIASVSWEDRLLLKGLESYVDDNGVGRDDIALIVGDLFQRDLVQDPSGTLRKVQEGLHRLCGAGLLWRYDHEGTPLLFISFWDKAQYVQKPQAGRNPRPDGTFDYKESVIGASPPESSGSIRNVPALNRGTGEQGNRGTEEQGNSSSAIADATPRPDVEALLDLLDSEIEANGGRKPKRTKKNEDAIRLMLDRDKIPAEDIAGAIRWCQADEFWRSNILSASKLREKYDTLRAQARRKKSQQAPMSKAAQNAARYREEFGDGGAGSVPALDAGFGV